MKVPTKLRSAVMIAAMAATAFLAGNAPVFAQEKVRIAGLTWPAYGFWFIAQEKGLAPGLDIEYQAIEDPFQSFSLSSSGQLDVISSTIEFAPIATGEKMPVSLVAYANLSYGSDKILARSDIRSAQDLIGKKVAVLEGGLSQLYMAIWLEENGVSYDQVEYVNLIMDDAVSAMIGGDVAASEFWEPFGQQLLDNLEGSHVLAQSREPDLLKSALIADAVFMNTDFIVERNDVAVETMQALYDAIAWWRENPAEGNEIIARNFKMQIEDVELVLGKDGTGEDGGMYPYSFFEAARFCGVAEGNPPFGQTNGQIVEHFSLINDWWVKFGLMSKHVDPAEGIDCSLLETLETAGYGQ